MSYPPMYDERPPCGAGTSLRLADEFRGARRRDHGFDRFDRPR